MATVDSAERRARLIELLERDGAIRLDDAAAELDVSTMTVRRDLADLEAEGRLSRVRGGAVAALRPRPFAERLAAGAAAKREIARKAVALLPDSGAIAVDASSTAGTLLAAAPESPRLLIATNSLENHASARATRARVVLIGGELQAETDSFVGPLACAGAAELHYDRFFTSASAVTRAGTSEVTLEEAQVKRVLVQPPPRRCCWSTPPSSSARPSPARSTGTRSRCSSPSSTPPTSDSTRSAASPTCADEH